MFAYPPKEIRSGIEAVQIEETYFEFKSEMKLPKSKYFLS